MTDICRPWEKCSLKKCSDLGFWIASNVGVLVYSAPISAQTKSSNMKGVDAIC